MINKPKYPIYVPSKNRHDVCYVAKCFIEWDIDFKIVVEPSQVTNYKNVFGLSRLLVLPEDGLRLLGSRLWIREHSIANGHERHWQFDDNITYFGRLNNGKRIRCNPNIAIKCVEDFTDRYTNIGISGFNYEMFVTNYCLKPYILNCKVYSASLINNTMPYKWRLYYNDDTDLCLQALSGGYCTLQFNAFHVKKLKTMTVKGGNTHDLYQGDGRLKMARALEEVWPDIVSTRWRFGRWQHVVNWNKFKDLKLIRRKDIDWQSMEKVNEYGLKKKKKY